jgi:predicted transcriptional regulator
MTKYTDLENNKEVTDVLFCIISDHNTVKEITKTLKQPQSTVSTKLQFLIENKVVIKRKWEFEPNWNRLYVVMYDVLKKNSPIALQLYMKSILKTDKEKIGKLRKVVKNIKLYFPESRLKRMLEIYSGLYFKGYSKASISDIINQYLVGLIETDRIKDKKLVELKKILMVMSKEVKFFQTTENISKY